MLHRYLATCLIGIAVLMSGTTARAATPAPGASHAVLLLDGVAAPILLKSFSGGSASAEVVLERGRSLHVQKKKLGPVRYDDIVLGIAPDQLAAMQFAVDDFLRGGDRRLNGAVLTLDASGRTAMAVEFTQGLLAELTLPAMDAASKDSGYLTVKISPETARITRDSGRVVKLGEAAVRSRPWALSHFRLLLDGLTTNRVTRIESLTLQRSITVRDFRDRWTSVEVGKLAISNLVLTVPEASAAPFYDWHEEFVIRAINGDDRERTGTLTLLASDLRTPLFELNLNHAGIIKCAPAAGASDAVRSHRVEMYLESATAGR